MAIVALESKTCIGGYAGQTLWTNRAVVIDTTVSGELPRVLLAPANARNIYVVQIPPDQFSRPTPVDMFLHRPYMLGIGNAYPNASNRYHPMYATERVIESGQYYLIGPSLLISSAIPSGWRVQLHRGGAYTMTEDSYVDSPQIRIPGNSVAVGAQGKFVYSTTNTVGTVIEYIPESKLLTILVDATQA